MRTVALAGGTGAAKLLRGLVAEVDPSELTIVVNTGDDIVLWGLHISPDVDTVVYALAGLLSAERGFGVSGDSFHCRDAIGRLGEPTFFALGDRDLALHLHRTRSLAEGTPLSQITARLARTFGVRCRVMPMSDDRVRTRIRTPEGWLEFQEFFVRERCAPAVLEVAYEGAAQAVPSPGLLSAIAEAEVVIVCPSNPITSIGPIRAIGPIEEALATTTAPVVAVSPIIARSAVSGPAAKLMVTQGHDPSATGVAKAYARWLDALVIDCVDRAEAPSIRALGVEPWIAATKMTNRDDERALARAILRELP